MSAYIHPTAVVDEGAEIGEGTKAVSYTHLDVYKRQILAREL